MIPQPGVVPGNQRLVVPAYFTPSAEKWRKMSDAIYNSLTTAVLIMNPNNGPVGTTPPADYRAVIDHCHAKRQTVIGYVATERGARALALVQADIAKYYELYPKINGIFFDQMSNKPQTKNHYLALYSFVKAQSAGALVVGNPGIPANQGGPLGDGAWQVTPPIVADVVVVFEGPYVRVASDPPERAQFKDWAPPAWVTSRSPDGFAHLVYESPDAKTTRSIGLSSQRRNARYIYVTEDTRPNPWDLPPGAATIAGPSLYRRPVIGS